jgi:hypothetical protein
VPGDNTGGASQTNAIQIAIAIGADANPSSVQHEPLPNALKMDACLAELHRSVLQG